MKTKLLILSLLVGMSQLAMAQNNFYYTVELTPVSLPNFPGLHSYAHAQADGKWLIIGGRKDGLHARQPFNAFPQASNNTDIYVVDIATQQFWSASVNNLPTGIAEQLLVTTGQPHAIASATGLPKPSMKEGCSNAAAPL